MPSLFPQAPAAAPAPYQRWTIERGMVDAEEPVGFELDGFGHAKLFTALRHFEGRTMVYAYEGRAGMEICGPKHDRKIAAEEARRILREVGRANFDATVDHWLQQREAQKKPTPTTTTETASCSSSSGLSPADGLVIGAGGEDH